MRLLITIKMDVRDDDEAREQYQEITEALANHNPPLDIDGRVSTKLERNPS